MILKLATYEIRSGNRLSGYVAQVSFGEPDVAALFCDAVSPWSRGRLLGPATWRTPWSCSTPVTAPDATSLVLGKRMARLSW